MSVPSRRGSTRWSPSWRTGPTPSFTSPCSRRTATRPWVRALEVVQSRLHEEDERLRNTPRQRGTPGAVRYLCGRADQTVQEVREVQFQLRRGRLRLKADG